MPSTPPRAAWGRDNSGRQYQRAVHLSPAAAGNPESFLLLSEVLLCCVSEQFLGWRFCFSINFPLPLKTLCYVLCLWMLFLYVHLCPTFAPGAGRGQEKHLILWNLSHRWLWATTWVRKLEEQSMLLTVGPAHQTLALLLETVSSDSFLWEAWECQLSREGTPSGRSLHFSGSCSPSLFPLTAHSAGS